MAEGHVVLVCSPAAGGRLQVTRGRRRGRRGRRLLPPGPAVSALKEEEVGRLLDDVPALHGLVEHRGSALALRLDALVVLVAFTDHRLPVVEQRRSDVLAGEGLALVVRPRLELAARVALGRDAVLGHLLREKLDLLLHLVAATHERRVVTLERRQIPVQLRAAAGHVFHPGSTLAFRRLLHAHL